MIRRPPRSTLSSSSAASDVYKRQIEHWGGRCYSWDVVNEALNGTGGWDQANPFYQVIGPAFFPIAFEAAEKAVKKTKADIKLYYNDYGIELVVPVPRVPSTPLLRSRRQTFRSMVLGSSRTLRSAGPRPLLRWFSR